MLESGLCAGLSSRSPRSGVSIVIVLGNLSPAASSVSSLDSLLSALVDSVLTTTASTLGSLRIGAIGRGTAGVAIAVLAGAIEAVSGPVPVCDNEARTAGRDGLGSEQREYTINKGIRDCTA